MEVGDALGLDALARRLLPLLGQDKLHARALLLGLRLELDRVREERRKRDGLEQHILEEDATRLEHPAQLRLELLLHLGSPARVERLGIRLARQAAHRRRELGHEEHAHIVRAEAEVDVAHARLVDVVEQRHVQVDCQPFLGRHVVLLLKELRLGRVRDHAGKGVDEVQARGERARADAAKRRDHADRRRLHSAHRHDPEERDEPDTPDGQISAALRGTSEEQGWPLLLMKAVLCLPFGGVGVVCDADDDVLDGSLHDLEYIELLTWLKLVQ